MENNNENKENKPEVKGPITPDKSVKETKPVEKKKKSYLWLWALLIICFSGGVASFVAILSSPVNNIVDRVSILEEQTKVNKADIEKVSSDLESYKSEANAHINSQDSLILAKSEEFINSLANYPSKSFVKSYVKSYSNENNKVLLNKLYPKLDSLMDKKIRALDINRRFDSLAKIYSTVAKKNLPVENFSPKPDTMFLKKDTGSVKLAPDPKNLKDNKKRTVTLKPIRPNVKRK